MSVGRNSCSICGNAHATHGGLCANCYDEAQYWKSVDEWAMTKRDGATIHLKPQRARGKNRF